MDVTAKIIFTILLTTQMLMFFIGYFNLYDRIEETERVIIQNCEMTNALKD